MRHWGRGGRGRPLDWVRDDEGAALPTARQAEGLYKGRRFAASVREQHPTPAPGRLCFARDFHSGGGGGGNSLQDVMSTNWL